MHHVTAGWAVGLPSVCHWCAPFGLLLGALRALIFCLSGFPLPPGSPDPSALPPAALCRPTTYGPTSFGGQALPSIPPGHVATCLVGRPVPQRAWSCRASTCWVSWRWETRRGTARRAVRAAAAPSCPARRRRRCDGGTRRSGPCERLCMAHRGTHAGIWLGCRGLGVWASSASAGRHASASAGPSVPRHRARRQSRRRTGQHSRERAGQGSCVRR